MAETIDWEARYKHLRYVAACVCCSEADLACPAESDGGTHIPIEECVGCEQGEAQTLNCWERELEFVADAQEETAD